MKVADLNVPMLSRDELDHDKFRQIYKPSVEATTEKAVLLSWALGPDDPIKTGRKEWLPKSQLRLDEEGNLWLSKWLWEYYQ